MNHPHRRAVCIAPAKINLGLRILERRPDGFHSIETVFQTLGLGDEIEVLDDGRAGFSCDLPGLQPEKNLAFQARSLFAAVVPAAAKVSLKIAKHIPAGGGLGGGSSDAAAVLLLLSGLFPEARLDLDTLALRLGSDVPFFLHPPTAHATGRGEILIPIPNIPLPKITLILPPFGCSTPAVFQALTAAERGPRQAMGARAWSELWQQNPRLALHNDLSAPARRVEPRMQILHDWLAQQPYPSAMSGSGSTCYVLGPVTTPPPLEGVRILTLP
jgi:4-diphosphocytidyl-2-C-methyl-D-erythritol kinase